MKVAAASAGLPAEIGGQPMLRGQPDHDVLAGRVSVGRHVLIPALATEVTVRHSQPLLEFDLLDGGRTLDAHKTVRGASSWAHRLIRPAARMACALRELRPVITLTWPPGWQR